MKKMREMSVEGSVVSLFYSRSTFYKLKTEHYRPLDEGRQRGNYVYHRPWPSPWSFHGHPFSKFFSFSFPSRAWWLRGVKSYSIRGQSKGKKAQKLAKHRKEPYSSVKRE